MRFLIEHHNRKKDSSELNEISNAIYDYYFERIEKTVKDIETVTCSFHHNVKNWSKEKVFIYSLHDKENKSAETDIKWSTFLGMVDLVLKNHSNFLETEKIIVCLEADKEKKEDAKDETTFDSKSEEKEYEKMSESTLNVEPVTPRYSMSQLVLAKDTQDALNDIITLIRKKDLIYKDWGFSDVDPVARSVVNFYGPPGTGKTMAAHAIVKELGLPFLPLNYSDIESKFVGDAPKNLVAAFKKAKETNSVLFFDEADSFLGKRITNVSSSSDQAINSLRSQMLILLETYDLITIFATNLKVNYDQAFESRILRNIQFNLPDKDLRIKIIDSFIPTKAPFERPSKDNEFWSNLGDLSDGLAPREIKNLVLNSLIKAATQEEQKITSCIFIDMFTQDKAKRDEEKRLREEKKTKLTNSIKENIENKNFNVVDKTTQTTEEDNHDR